MPKDRWIIAGAIIGSALLFREGCSMPSATDRQLLALVDRPDTRGQRPHCVPEGARELTAALRSPTYCITGYSDGNAIWHRDARGRLINAGRMWPMWAEDSLAWRHLRDSVMAAVARVEGAVPCADQAYGNGGWVTAWQKPDYEFAVVRFDPRLSGGFELRVIVNRLRGSLCRPLD